MKNTLLVSLLGITTLVSACQSGQKDAQNSDKYIITAPIVMDTLYQNDYVAEINALLNVEIRAKVKGFLDRVYVDEGMPVKAGQVLFTINNQNYKIAVLKAKAQLRSAVAEAKTAELEVQNVSTLLQKNVVSRAELEMAQAKWSALQAKVEQARAEEESAALDLSFTEIRAPFDGVINRIPYKTGSLVDEGGLLTTISNTQFVYAYFHVSEREYLDYFQRKTNAAPDSVGLVLANNRLHTQQGVIETIEGEINRNTGNIAFRAKFANVGQLLRHGSSGKVRVRNALKNALVIPQKATFEIQDRIYVFVIDAQGIAKMRHVVVQRRLPHLYVLESGLSPQDRILYEGVQNIREGAKPNTQFMALPSLMKQATR